MQEQFQLIVEFFTPQVINFVGVVLGVIALFAIVAVANAFRKTEFFRQYGRMSEELDDFIFNTIIVAGLADGWDEEKYTALAEEFNKQVDLDLDPRMYYVVIRAQAKLEQFGYNMPLLELYERAEGIYQSIKRDPSNGIEL